MVSVSMLAMSPASSAQSEIPGFGSLLHRWLLAACYTNWSCALEPESHVGCVYVGSSGVVALYGLSQWHHGRHCDVAFSVCATAVVLGTVVACTCLPSSSRESCILAECRYLTGVWAHHGRTELLQCYRSASSVPRDSEHTPNGWPRWGSGAWTRSFDWLWLPYWDDCTVTMMLCWKWCLRNSIQKRFGSVWQDGFYKNL